MLPAGRQLRGLHLEHCDPSVGHAMEPVCAPINLLNWLEKTQPQATVQISHVQLALGSLSMKEAAKRLSQLATCSITFQHCPLLGHDGCLSKHGVADLALYMEQHIGRRVMVTYDWDDNRCKIVRVG